MIWSWRQKLQGRPCNLLSRIVQYWTAIYPRLADHRCGVGALLVSNFSASSSSRSRMMEPVMKAVSTLARELFR